MTVRNKPRAFRCLLGAFTLLSPLPLAAFSTPETIPGAPDAEDIAAVQDKAGNIHAVTISAADTGGEEVKYHFFDGASWQPSTQIGIEVTDYANIDLALDESGGLHATAFGATTVFYFHRPPGGSWALDLLGNTSETATNPGPENATSIDTATSSNGTVTRHVAYSGEIDGDFVLRYATSTDGTNWSITTAADADIGSGLAPVISAEPWPVASFVPTRSAPVIVYGEGTTDELRVTYLTEPFGGGAPSWTEPAVIGETVSLDEGRGPDLLIEDGVAHVAYIGTAVGAPPDARPRYHRRDVTASIISPGGQVREIDERIVDSDEERQLALALSGGEPAVLFQRRDDGASFPNLNLPTVQVARRNGPDSWTTETALGGVATQTAPPTGTALTTGPFGRLSAILARSGGDTTAVRETGTASRPFSVEPVTNFDDSVPPDIVPDGFGGAWVAYVADSGKTTLAHFAPDGSLLEETVLDDGRESTSGINPTTVERDQVHLERLDSGRLALGYRTTVSDSVLPDSHYVHVFLLDGTARASFDEISFSFLNGPPSIDLAVDGGDTWIITSQSGGTSPTNLMAYDSAGNRRTSVENQYDSSSPTPLRSPKIAADDESVVILGTDGSQLRASTFNPFEDSWSHGETVATFDSQADVPASYDVVLRFAFEQSAEVNGVVANAVHAHDGEIILTYRSGGSTWTPFPIHALASEADSATVLLKQINGDLNDTTFQLAWSRLTGANANDLLYAAFTNPGGIAPSPSPVDTGNFLAVEGPVFGSGDRFGLAVDRLGLRYLAARDDHAGALRVSLPRAAADEDADGLPLFHELAFCRDPDTPDAGGLLRISHTAPAQSPDLFELRYRRPAGPAEIDSGDLVTGRFHYELRGSDDLRSFSGSMESILQSAPDTVPSPTPGAVEQVFEVTSPNPEFFYRLDVGLRRDE